MPYYRFSYFHVYKIRGRALFIEISCSESLERMQLIRAEAVKQLPTRITVLLLILLSKEKIDVNIAEGIYNALHIL